MLTCRGSTNATDGCQKQDVDDGVNQSNTRVLHSLGFSDEIRTAIGNC